MGFNFSFLRKALMDKRVTAQCLTLTYIKREGGLPKQPQSSVSQQVICSEITATTLDYAVPSTPTPLQVLRKYL